MQHPLQLTESLIKICLKEYFRPSQMPFFLFIWIQFNY